MSLADLIHVCTHVSIVYMYVFVHLNILCICLDIKNNTCLEVWVLLVHRTFYVHYTLTDNLQQRS